MTSSIRSREIRLIYGYTSIVRENSLTLYGFARDEEKDVFMLLIDRREWNWAGDSLGGFGGGYQLKASNRQ